MIRSSSADSSPASAPVRRPAAASASPAFLAAAMCSLTFSRSALVLSPLSASGWQYSHAAVIVAHCGALSRSFVPIGSSASAVASFLSFGDARVDAALGGSDYTPFVSGGTSTSGALLGLRTLLRLRVP